MASKSFVEFSDLVAKRARELYVPLGKDIGITVEWLPDTMTPELYARMSDDTERANDPFVIAREVLAPMIAKWDLKRDGKDYPPTEENIANLGLAICQQMLRAVFADFRVASSEDYTDTKGDSGDTSSATLAD